MRETNEMLAGGRRGGFTMMELLAVMIIIAMLIGIAITAAQWVFHSVRAKRYEISCRVLESAIYRYHHEYREWPIPDADYQDGKYTYSYNNTDNKKCFEMLRRASANNSKQIPFIDESGLFAEKGGKVVPLVAAGEGIFPLVYRDRNNKKKYFSVTIDVEAEKVTVN